VVYIFIARYLKLHFPQIFPTIALCFSFRTDPTDSTDSSAFFQSITVFVSIFFSFILLFRVLVPFSRLNWLQSGIERTLN